MSHPFFRPRWRRESAARGDAIRRPAVAARRAAARTWPNRAALILAAGWSVLASAAWAHPMGNFTVNRYTRLEPSAQSFAVTVVVDYAEIPTFQEIGRVPTLAADITPQVLGRAPAARQLERRLAAAWADGLHVTANGRPVALELRSATLDFFPGAGGLPTMKLHLRLEGRWPVTGDATVRYEDTNAPERLGWREVVLRPASDLPPIDSPVSRVDRSRALTRYPLDPSAALPQETSASLRVRGLRAAAIAANSQPDIIGTRPARTTGTVRPGGSDRLAALITPTHWTPAVVAFSLLIAFALGGLHALSPGHGKTIVAAYLVGARGTSRHAILLGAIVTAAHTAGVFLLGAVTLALSAQVVPETLYPVVQLCSGVAIVAIGATMFAARLREAPHVHTHAAFGRHTHAPGVPHDHAHHVHALPQGSPTVARLLALGVSGGILPCPSALVVLLSAVALHRIGVGLVLIVAFSMGLAAVLSGIGIAVVRAGTAVARLAPAAAIVQRVPAFSALFVTVLGIGMTAAALADMRRAFF